MSASPHIAVDAPILQAEGLEIGLPGRRLLSGLDLQLFAGEVLVIIGPNGAGKSTLLSVLAGLNPPQAGRVLLAGLPYEVLPGREAALLRGLLLQGQQDHFSSSVLETVLVGRHPHLDRWAWEGEDDARIACAALAELGLAGFEQRNVLGLSGGERQRVAIATLRAQDPALYLLDEPLSHLDLHHQIAVLDLFAGLAKQGRSVVLVQHEINLVARIASRVLLLDGRGGHVLGSPAEVLRADLLGAAFGHPLRRIEADGQVLFIPE